MTVATVISGAPIGSGPSANYYISYGGGVVWGGLLVGGRLMANSASNFWTRADDSPFFEPGDGVGFWNDAYKAMLFQTEVIVPTRAAVGSQMTLDVAITGEPVRIEYRHAPQALMFPLADNEPFWNVSDNAFFYDDPFFGDVPFIAWPGMVTAKNEQYQFQFYTGGGSTQGVIDTCRVLIDAPDIVEAINDFNISASGTRLPITKPFTVIKNVQVTLQATTGGTAVSVEVVDKNAETGPLIRCKNAAGAAVAGFIDAVVQGY